MSPMISRPLTIELALLGYLRPEPLHAYQIHQLHLAPDGLGQVWRLKQAQLYALLAKLEEAGFIRSAIQVQETRPNRRMYQLTIHGQDVFENWLVTPVDTPRQIRQEFMAKRFFAQREDRKVEDLLLDRQLEICRRWIANQQDQIHAAPEASFERLVHQYRLGQIQAAWEWLVQLK